MEVDLIFWGEMQDNLNLLANERQPQEARTILHGVLISEKVGDNKL